MKTLKILFLTLFICSTAAAQSPQSFKYQAVARNSEGSAIVNSPVGLQFSILTNNVDGTVVYQETFTANSNASGVFNVNIGEGNVQSGSFADIDWGGNLHFLQVAMDIDGGTNYVEMGTSQLLSVPYSLHTASIYVHYSGDTLYIGDKYVIIEGGSGPPAGTVTDYDGNVYETVVIGTQTWMKENLRSLHYTDGTIIEDVYAYEDNESYVDAYGRLYVWNAVVRMAKNPSERAQGICPGGWHVPSKAECETLINHLGGLVIAGGKMKETGFTYWEEPNEEATNESEFSGRGAGYRGQAGNYTALKQLGAFWTSDEDGLKATRMALFNDIGNAFTGDFQKTIGYSARCLKD